VDSGRIGERVSSSTSSWGEGGAGLEEQQPRSLVMRLMVGGTVLGGFEGVWCAGDKMNDGSGGPQVCLVCRA
jgi:hypothetical protein